MKFYTLRFLLIFCFFINLQFGYSQTGDWCGTHGISANGIGALPPSTGIVPQAPYYFKLKIFSISKEDDDGNWIQGQSFGDIEQMVQNLNSDFNSFGIFFVWDCQIHSLENENYEDPNILNNVCAEYFQHPNVDNNAINIFLSPDDVTSNQSGVAEDTPSKAFWLAGNQLTSSIPSHEMGHCLGLYHTFLGTAKPNTGTSRQGVCGGSRTTSNCELVSDYMNSSGDSVGDFVSDTHADPGNSGSGGSNFWFYIPQSDCDFEINQSYLEITQLVNCMEKDVSPATFADINGEPYTPPLNNIMSYQIYDHCRELFTVGQGERMRAIIDMNQADIQDALFQPDHPDGLVIDEDTQWELPDDERKSIQGDLRLKSGFTLTIGAGVTVGFGPGSKLIVEPGATLDLSGTLTGFGCPFSVNTWEGVEVWGGASNQYTGGVGELICNPGSVIEFANTGAKLFNSAGGAAGGAISCDGATFRNNAIGVEIASYSNPVLPNGTLVGYRASFKECNFTIDDDYFNSNPFFAHIKMGGVIGVNINGCHFDNESLLNRSNSNAGGYGIHAISSGFRVGPKCLNSDCTDMIKSEFINLGVGILNGAGLASKAYSVKHSLFQRCESGIWNLGTTGGIILFNTFEVGNDIGESSLPYQSGIYFAGGIENYVCQENEFISLSDPIGGIPTYGTISVGTGDITKEIKRNQFSLFSKANLAQLGNGDFDFQRGLMYLCNENRDNLEDIVTEFGLIRPVQEGIGGTAAGNIFSSSLNQVHLSNNIDLPITYRYYDGNIDEVPDPTKVLGLFDLNISFPNSCEPEYCHPPCPTGDPDFPSLRNSFNNAKTILDEIANESGSEYTDEQLIQIKNYQFIKDKAAQVMVQYFLEDTTGVHQDSLLTWIKNLSTFSSYLWLAGEHRQTGDYANSNQILSEIPSEFDLSSDQSDDLNNFQNLLQLIGEQSIFNLDSLTLKQIKNFENIGGNTQVKARNILSYYGYHFVNSILEPEPVEQKIGTQFNLLKSAQQNIVKVYPNPVIDEITFQYSLEPEANSKILIYNINGTCINKIDIDSNETLLKLNENSGIYFYRIISGKSTLSSGRFIVK